MRSNHWARNRGQFVGDEWEDGPVVIAEELKVEHDSWSEGPEHDPYSVEQITVSQKGVRVEFRLGMVCALRVTMKRCQYTCHGYGPDDREKQLFNWFERITGKKLDEFMQDERDEEAVCKECGASDFEWTPGYPGETFLICQKCGAHAGMCFNESAII